MASGTWEWLAPFGEGDSPPAGILVVVGMEVAGWLTRNVTVTRKQPAYADPTSSVSHPSLKP